MDEGLFRKTAIEHYLRGEEGGSPIRISPPWTWALFWTLAAALVAALIASVTGRVEVTARGRGILLPTPGIQVLNSPMGGTVAEVYVRSGQDVRAGETLLRLDSASLQSQLLETQRDLQMLQSDYRAFSARQDQFYAEQEASLRSRTTMMEEQVASQANSVGLYERKLAANKELQKAGLVSDIVVAEAAEALAQAQRQLGSSRQALVQTHQELASLQARREDELWQREHDLRQAEAKRDALQFSIGQTEVKAPIDASVESVLVKPGDFIQTGQALGRLVPKGTPLHVVAFIPEKDRAFVKTGDEARLELDQLPYAEFGTLKARVLRIAGDLASAQEIQESMGDASKMDGAFYRADLELEPSHSLAKAPLRTGMLMNVRFTLRTQRPITLFFEPLRRWLN
jgi:multidrug resistance efflux pump